MVYEKFGMLIDIIKGYGYMNCCLYLVRNI